LLWRPEAKLGWAAVALFVVLLAAGAASGDERTLVLEVVMNGRATGQVGEFTERDGVLYAKPSELRELGFVLPRDIAAGDVPIPLTALPNVRSQVNEAQQTLVVVAANSALRPTEVGGGTSAPLASLSPAGYGVVLDYDLAATFTGREATGGAFLDARAFSPFGLLQSTGFANIAPIAGGKSLVRFDTTYTYSQPDELRRWRVGDVVSGALAWTRAVRLGGIQVASDFSLRPDLVTYPVPQISSAAAVPSTVDVLVNGVRQLSEDVPPGPFTVRTLPVVTGAGEMVVAVMDVLGRQTFVTLPFYASSALLTPGLGSYSIEAGAVRQNYGLADDRYSGWGASGSARYGLTNWLTLETHGEATEGLELVGGGVTALVGRLGVVDVAIAASADRGRGGASADGALLWASFQRVAGRLSFSVSGELSTSGYSDIAAEYGTPPPKSTLAVNLGYQLGAWGNVGVGYNSQISGKPIEPPLGLPNSSVADPPVALVTASYSVSIGRASFYATGFDNLRETRAIGVSVGVSLALGVATSASVETSLEGGRSTTSVSAVRSPERPNDYGYRLLDSEGDAPDRSAEGEFLSPWGLLSAGIDQSAGGIAERVGADGALVLAGGRLFASPRIVDSFAMVSTGNVAGVPVLYENRFVGNTDAFGKLLVPSLLSYQDNLLTLDASRLTPDIEVGQTSILVRPADRSGVMVDFHVRKVNAALLTLHDRAGHPLPLGSVAMVSGAKDAPVGYDGAAYVTGLKPTNHMKVLLPDGTTCGVVFDYKPVNGDIPLIGPLVCQ
jgi:outer membrane usher protein